MKQKQISFLHDMLIVPMNHCLFFAAAVTFLGFLERNNAHLFLWLALMIVPVIFRIIRGKVSNHLLFGVLHLIIPVGICYLPIEIYGKVTAVLVVLAYIVLSTVIKVKFKSKQDICFHPAFVISAASVLALIEAFHNKQGWEAYYTAAALIYLTLYFVYLFTEQYLQFLSVSESSASNIPKLKIFTSGIRQTFIFTAACTLLVALASAFDRLDNIVRLLGNGLLFIIRKFFSLFKYSNTSEGNENFVSDIEKPAALSSITETSDFWEMLEKILMVVTVIVAVAIVFGLIILIFKFLRNGFSSAANGDPSNTEDQDLRERCDIENIRKSKGKRPAFWDRRSKVRRIYRNRVLKGRAAIIGSKSKKELEYMTAGECCEKLSADNLQRVYEKAKYSSEEITSADLKYL